MKSSRRSNFVIASPQTLVDDGAHHIQSSILSAKSERWERISMASDPATQANSFLEDNTGGQ
jgi:hypothetical protein